MTARRTVRDRPAVRIRDGVLVAASLGVVAATILGIGPFDPGGPRGEHREGVWLAMAADPGAAVGSLR